MEKTLKRELFEWTKLLVITAVFVVVIRSFLFTPVAVQGASMMPTYEDGDTVIVNKINKSFSNFDHFDVIVFKATEEDNYIKRVIGLPGDKITYENDTLYINDKAYDEPYLEAYKEQLGTGRTLTDDFTLESVTGETTVPEGHLFVLGDNRQRSVDSRYAQVGFVEMDAVLGTTSLRIAPLNSMGIVK